MKKMVFTITAIALVALCAHRAHAGGPSFPDKGWHTGPYLAVTGGMMQATDDTNVVTNRKFNGSFIPSVGLTFGWDFTDWIGIMLQGNFGFASDQVGNGSADYPSENGDEYALNATLAARYIFLTNWEGQPSSVRILPYVKLGGTGRALYVHASGGNQIGAYGGGVATGAGVEFLVIDRIFLALDMTENLMFMQDYSKTVGGVTTQIIKGGFKPQFQLLGMVGYHF